jgi:hypothetical protein
MMTSAGHPREGKSMQGGIKSALLAGVLAVCAASPAAAATPAERKVYKDALVRAASDFQAARVPCRALAGNPKAVCYEEARAGRVRAESLAEATYRNSPRARADAEIAIAKADYAVAKKKCGAAPDRSACLHAAREVQGKAVTEALNKRGARKP